MNLNIATGLKEYDITDENGNVKAKVCFNPTDPAFAERLFNLLGSLDEKDKEYHDSASKEPDNSRLFEYARKMDVEMRQMLDEALGAEICQPVFGGISVYAWADGLPLWANLLLAIIDEMDDAVTREKKASDPRIKKYTKKFKKT